jgi:hypothetical protein
MIPPRMRLRALHGEARFLRSRPTVHRHCFIRQDAPNTPLGMPTKSRRIFATHTVRFSKTVGAPLAFVYDWCTDFRSDDGKLAKSKSRYKVLHLAKDRVVRIRSSPTPARSPQIAIELVRLRPPSAWHVDQIDETDLAAVDYKLVKLGPRKTRVELVITERWMTPSFPGRDAYLRSVIAYWDDLMSALMTRYRNGRPAVG